MTAFISGPWISIGILLAFALAVFCLIKWRNLECIGVTPVPMFTLAAILFTSGLDVGLIMFPLTEFPVYADTASDPSYGFTNPLAIEFGFWGFLIWGFYFLTTFYFCVIEPRVKFFEIPYVKYANNIVIICTCAFTASLFLLFSPWYLSSILGGDGESVTFIYFIITAVVIVLACYSSTDIKYVRILSLGSTFAFFALALIIWMYSGGGFSGLFGNLGSLIGGYFGNIHKFVLPINSYHAFYLLWWFAWSTMIGQFTARFVGGLKTWQLLLALLILPSIPIAVWFSILYQFHIDGADIQGFFLVLMALVGLTFVVNSLDSLIRLYTDNLGQTVAKLGKRVYIIGNLVLLMFLAVVFYGLGSALGDAFIAMRYIGAVVILIYIVAVVYHIVKAKELNILSINSSPEENTLDFDRINRVR